MYVGFSSEDSEQTQFFAHLQISYAPDIHVGYFINIFFSN